MGYDQGGRAAGSAVRASGCVAARSVPARLPFGRLDLGFAKVSLYGDSVVAPSPIDLKSPLAALHASRAYIPLAAFVETAWVAVAVSG